MRLTVDDLLLPVSNVLDREDIPIIVWGEVAMKLNNIPTAVLRVDILVPDDMFPCAKSALDAEGWTVSTGPFPRARAGFDQTGWKVVADACLRYRYPHSVVPEEEGIDLFILPTSFVGLGRTPDLETGEYTRIQSAGSNVYLPSTHLMAKSIALTHIRNIRKENKGTNNFSLLLLSWAAYFYDYCGFHEGSMDEDEGDVKEFWRSVMPKD